MDLFVAQPSMKAEKGNSDIRIQTSWLSWPSRVVYTACMYYIWAKFQFRRKFCWFPLSHPIYFDYSFFLCNLVGELNKLN